MYFQAFGQNAALRTSRKKQKHSYLMKLIAVAFRLRDVYAFHVLNWTGALDIQACLPAVGLILIKFFFIHNIFQVEGSATTLISAIFQLLHDSDLAGK